MSGRMVTAALLAALAGAGAVASVRAGEGRFGERRFGWGGPGRWSALSAEDRAAFAEARLAALHAGLRLNADQDKLWPPVEAALRDLARQREARRAALRGSDGNREADPPAILRGMADAATARGEALRRLADAAAPLYATLDDGQKRRASILARPIGRGMRRGFGRSRDDGGEAPGPR